MTRVVKSFRFLVETRFRRVVVAVFMAAAIVVGCRGGDSGDDESTDSKGPTGGAGGAADAGMPPRMTEVECGDATCTVPPIAMSLVKPCCVDSTAGECGFMSAFTENRCVAEAPPHPVCPSVTISGVMAGGCCSRNGQCGVDGSAIGMGCVELSAAAATGGSAVEAPPPQACTPDGEDAGASDEEDADASDEGDAGASDEGDAGGPAATDAGDSG